MSQRERDRLKVLGEIEQGRVTQKEGAEQLRLSDRWVRKLQGRVRREGDAGVVHRLRGRPSNRKLSKALRTKVVKAMRQSYVDFGPTLASEYLAKREGIRISKEALRKLLIESGMWTAHPRKVQRAHLWRPRRSCRGELVQWDTSVHDWLEGRGPVRYLIAMIDDASNRLQARFVRQDTTEENLCMLKGYLERWGRPLAFYTDRAGMFQVNRAPQMNEQLRGQAALTQIGRALEELGIERITARSPQAKGRVERCFGTLQDRLVKGLRLAGACTREQANRYLEKEFLPEWEKRFTVQPENPTDAHRRLGKEQDLTAILSVVEERVVANDYTISYAGKRYQIARADLSGGMRGAKVRVEKRLDGTIAVRFGNRYRRVSVCARRTPVKTLPPHAPAPKTAASVPRPKPPNWMQGFSLKTSPPLWKVLKQETNTPIAPAGSP